MLLVPGNGLNSAYSKINRIHFYQKKYVKDNYFLSLNQYITVHWKTKGLIEQSLRILPTACALPHIFLALKKLL